MPSLRRDYTTAVNDAIRRTRTKDRVFDRVWVITYKDGEARLRNRPQALMPQDEKD
jgi:hypothetical protein